jgi:hypothetical protein
MRGCADARMRGCADARMRGIMPGPLHIANCELRIAYGTPATRNLNLRLRASPPPRIPASAPPRFHASALPHISASIPPFKSPSGIMAAGSL